MSSEHDLEHDYIYGEPHTHEFGLADIGFTVIIVLIILICAGFTGTL